MTGIAIVKPERNFYTNEDRGFVRPVLIVNADGSYSLVDPDEFPNNGQIMVVSGYQELSKSTNFLLRVEYKPANHFEGDNPQQSKYVTRGSSAERLNKSAICSVIEDRIPTPDSRSLVVTGSPPTPWIFIKAVEGEEEFIVGPFDAKVYEEEEEGAQYKIELNPVDTVIPGFNSAVSHAVFKVNTKTLPEQSFFNVGNDCFFTDVRAISSLVYETIDFCNEEQLLRWGEDLLKAQKIIKKVNKDKIVEIKSAIGKLKKINTPFLEMRRKRLVSVLGNLEEWKGFSSSILSDYINTPSGKKELESYIELNKASYLDELVFHEKEYRREEIEKEIDKENRRLSQKRKDLEEIESRLSEARDKENERLSKDLDAELESKKAIVIDIDKEIENKTIALQELSNLENLESTKSNLRAEIGLLNEQREESRDLLKVLKNQLNTERTDYTATLLKLRTELDVLSGDIDSGDEGGHKFEGTLLSVNKGEHFLSQQQEVIGNIKELISDVGGREFDETTAVNLISVLLQNFITTIAGLPGTGKTSTANLLARSLSLNDLCLQVQVERAWSSPKDLVGYYNPLNNRFQQSSSGLYNLIKSMHENKSLDSLGIALLDEANLSPLEHYWSTFMGMCDDGGSKELVTGDKRHNLDIPESFRFLATVNYDQTTENLSPRFLDRSPVIELDSSVGLNILDVVGATVGEFPDSYYSFSDLYRLFGRAEEASFSNDEARSLKGILSGMMSQEDLSKSAPIPISPRKIISIKNYCYRTRAIYQEDYPTKSLDIAIAQNILPLIDGHGSSYLERLEHVLTLLPTSGFPISRRRLEAIVDKGTSNYESFSYFRS